MTVQSDNSIRTDDNARRDVAQTLGRHMADGRLTLGEYEERLEQTFGAVTESDLARVLDDLPTIQTPAERQDRRQTARFRVAGWLGLCVLFVTIWALTGADYFWPIWPMFGTGMGTLPGAYALWTGVDQAEGTGPKTGQVNRRACGGRSRSR